MFTEPFTVHRMDHNGRGIQQGPEHGCFEAAKVAAELLMAADQPTALNPRAPWWIAAKQVGGRFEITHLPRSK